MEFFTNDTKPEDLWEAILNLLAASDDPMDALKISKAIFGPKGTKKQVNPHLYKLLGKKKLEKLAPTTGQRPRWCVNTL